MRSLIVEKGPGPVEDDPDALVKGWLQREVRGGVKTPWIRPRKYWFVLTPDSLDYYSSNERGAKRLGSLVLTSLCSVLWPDKQTYKETGYWSVTVFGRKHCYRLYTERLNEAVHWVCAVQKVIDSKAPVQTPTQLLMRDVEVSPRPSAGAPGFALILLCVSTCSHGKRIPTSTVSSCPSPILGQGM
nr:PREDICTED: pleckstrin homology domain-containing family H member 3 [Apteryx mantelli mantelli]